MTDFEHSRYVRSVRDSPRPRQTRLAELLKVAGAEALDMVLSIRLLFLVITYAGVGFLTGYLWVSADNSSEGQLTEFSKQVASLSAEDRLARLEQIAAEGGPMAQVAQTLGSVVFDPSLPPLAMLVLSLTSSILPLLILLVGYNRISDDLESRYTRYILQRVHRESYLGGKILGHAAVCTISVLIVQLAWIAVAMVQDLYGADRLISGTLRIWPAMILFVLTYSSYTMLASTAFGRSVLALLLGAIFLFAFWFAFQLASVVWAPLTEVWISSWYDNLWISDLRAYAVFAAYGLGFALLARAILRRADV